MNPILEKIISTFVDKKRIIGWGSAILMVIGAALASMQTSEFKAAVCDAPVINAPTPAITGGK